MGENLKYFRPMTFKELITASLIDRHESEGLEFESAGGINIYTFRDIAIRAGQFAAAMRDSGMSSGDRVACFLPNSPDVIALFLAVSYIGAIVVPINTMYRESELRHILTDSEPAAVVTTAELAEFLPKETAFWLIDSLAKRSETFKPIEPADVDEHKPLMLAYTSGTTGRSKGAVISRAAYAFNAWTLTSLWEITSDDRYLAVLPLFHVHGLGNGVGCWLASGCRMRLAPRFESATASTLFEQFRPTLFFAVPTIYYRLLELGPEMLEHLRSDARLLVSGSAPLPAEMLEAFEVAFGHRILERYGMSETLMIASNPLRGERRSGTVGMPLPGVEVRLFDRDLNDVQQGTSGEVAVRGANVLKEYWRSPEATQRAFKDGWFLTGDIGTLSQDGYLTLTGRRSELIISGGFNVYPREIEEILLSHPAVREAAVRGVPDPARGEVPAAYLVMDSEVPDDELEAYCRRSLASFKIPRAFVRLEGLPRNAMGKVQKHLLPVSPEA